MPSSDFYLKGASKKELLEEANLPREQRSQTMRTIYYVFRWGQPVKFQYCTNERIRQCDWVERDKKGIVQRVNPKVIGSEAINEVLDDIKSKVEKTEKEIRKAGGIATQEQLLASLKPSEEIPDDNTTPPATTPPSDSPEPEITPDGPSEIIPQEAAAPITFYKFYEEYQKSIPKGNKKNFDKCLVHLKAFNPELNWSSFTKAFRNDYVEFLSTVYINPRTKQPGILNGTIGKDIRCIKAVLQEADTASADLDIKVPRWYLKYKKPRYNPKKDARRFSISEQRLQHLINFDFRDPALVDWDHTGDTGKFAPTENLKIIIPNIEKVRDHYIVSFYLGLSHEARVSALPDQINDDVDDTGLPIKVLKISRAKTQSSNSIPIPQIVLDIFEKYKGQQIGLLPYFCNQQFNRICKRMFRIAGFTNKITLIRWSGDRKVIEVFEECDLLTSHSARHSLADHILDSGGDLLLVKDTLGHESITTSEIYGKGDRLKFNRRILNITEKNSKLKVS
jgi:integrase